MPTLAAGFGQVTVSAPLDVIADCRANVAASGSSLNWEIERFLHKLAGRRPPKTQRKPGRKKNLAKS